MPWTYLVHDIAIKLLLATRYNLVHWSLKLVVVVSSSVPVYRYWFSKRRPRKCCRLQVPVPVFDSYVVTCWHQHVWIIYRETCYQGTRPYSGVTRVPDSYWYSFTKVQAQTDTCTTKNNYEQQIIPIKWCKMYRELGSWYSNQKRAPFCGNL